MGLAPRRTLSRDVWTKSSLIHHRAEGKEKLLRLHRVTKVSSQKLALLPLQCPHQGSAPLTQLPTPHHRAEKQLKTSRSPNPQPCCHHLARALKTQAKPQHQLTSPFPSPSASQDRFSMCSFFI